MNGDEDGVEDGGTSGGEESCENGGEVWNCRVAFTTEVLSYGFWSLLLLHQIPKKILYVFFYVNFSFQAPLKCIQLLSFVFVWI